MFPDFFPAFVLVYIKFDLVWLFWKLRINLLITFLNLFLEPVSSTE
jgi:hypothetical protein